MATSAELTGEEDKELLLCRVNELVFVDALAGYECRRCERTLIRHYLAPCGHYFCPNCKRLLLQSKSNCPLPACRQPLKDMDVQSVVFEQKLYDLRAHCPNKKYGCKFVSQLKDLGGHLRVCKDTREAALPVEIPGPSALETFMRELSIKFGKLSADVNKIKEDTSRIDKGLKDIKTEVDRKFKSIEVKVDNNAIEMKAEIDQNLKEVIKIFDGKWSETSNSVKDIETKVDNNKEDLVGKMAEIKKTFDGKTSETVNSLKDIKVEMERKMKNITTTIEKATQNNQLLNNSKLEQKVFHLESFVLLRNPQINDFTLAEDKCNFQPDFTWKISGLKEKLKQTNFEIKSETFTWTEYPVQAQSKLKVEKDGGVWVSLCLKEINEGKAYHLKLIPYVYYVLRDRSGNRDTKRMSRSCTHLFRSTFKPSLTFEPPLTNKSLLTVPLYNVDDSIVVEVYVEPPSMAQLVHLYDGTLVWAIDNYRKKKGMAKEQLVFCQDSPYFYTAPNGYRVQVLMWLDGFGEYTGKGLTAQINFLPGEFDTDLPLTFPHRTTITLFNRKDPQRNITKTIDQDIQTKKEYLIDVCSDEEIENVIDNDTVFLKVTIKPQS